MHTHTETDGKYANLYIESLQSLTKLTLTTPSHDDLVQVIYKPTHKCGHIIDWVVVRPVDDIHKNLLFRTYLNHTIIILNHTHIQDT